MSAPVPVTVRRRDQTHGPEMALEPEPGLVRALVRARAQARDPVTGLAMGCVRATGSVTVLVTVRCRGWGPDSVNAPEPLLATKPA